MGQSAKRPPYLNIYRDRHGRERIYFRRKGYPAVPLSTPLYSDEFWAAYQKAMTLPKRAIGAARTKPGTINELIVSYYRSPEFTTLRASTKATYRGIIERFRKDHGDKRVAKLQRKHIRQMFQAKAETPNAANNFLRILHLLMRHAMEMEMRSDDPTDGIRKFKISGGGHKSWEEPDIEAYERCHQPGSKSHLALMLLLYTGLRRSDVVRVGPQHLNAGFLTIEQTKTGTSMSIPVHPRLHRALREVDTKHMVYLTTAFGKPFTANGFGNWFRDQVRLAKLDGLSAHGLRKAIARRLAEAGCTPHEIMSITGHESLKEVQRYAATANRKKMAKSAMNKITS
ncbi:MAG: tyrosine-type recombinase/integrase [Pseudomonadota bacterium]